MQDWDAGTVDKGPADGPRLGRDGGAAARGLADGGAGDGDVGPHCVRTTMHRQMDGRISGAHGGAAAARARGR